MGDTSTRQRKRIKLISKVKCNIRKRGKLINTNVY